MPVSGCLRAVQPARLVSLPGFCMSETPLTSSHPDVVLMYHGGAFAVGTDSDVPAPEVDYLLSKGVVVVSAQYRLAPQSGLQYYILDFPNMAELMS